MLHKMSSLWLPLWENVFCSSSSQETCCYHVNKDINIRKMGCMYTQLHVHCRNSLFTRQTSVNLRYALFPSPLFTEYNWPIHLWGSLVMCYCKRWLGCSIEVYDYNSSFLDLFLHSLCDLMTAEFEYSLRRTLNWGLCSMSLLQITLLRNKLWDCVFPREDWRIWYVRHVFDMPC